MASLKKFYHHSADSSSGVLDLSSSRKTKPDIDEKTKIYDDRRSPDTQSHSSPSVDRLISTRHFTGGQIDDNYHSKNYENGWNSFYHTYPVQASIEGNVSPNYASCYPGTEHLSPYILQAAFRQQTILQNKRTSPKIDCETLSEAGSEGSTVSSLPIYPMTTPGRDGKVPRPFKAYPKDPLSLAAGFTNIDAILDTQSAEKYSAFRKRMLEQICEANGGQATVSNPKMRRVINHNSNVNNNNNNDCYLNDDSSKYDQPIKDDSYTERRKKNNAAAKKSRDRRRIKEDEIAIRAAFLERENIELKFELAAARKQLALCGITVTTSSA